MEFHTALVISSPEDWMKSAKLTVNIDNGVGEKISVSCTVYQNVLTLNLSIF